jgi:hypothetical protein
LEFRQGAHPVLKTKASFYYRGSNSLHHNLEDTMKAKWMVSIVVVAAALMLAPGGAQAAGTTQLLVGAPNYSGGPPINLATVTITMELDGTTKSFTNYSVNVYDVTFIRRPVGFTQTFPSGPPTPGGGPVTFDIMFTIVKGRSYEIDAVMNYVDGMGLPQTISKMPIIKP